MTKVELDAVKGSASSFARTKYAYYNEDSDPRFTWKDPPCERFGDIIAQPILGRLHHRYARI